MRNITICILLTSLAASMPACINADPSTFPNLDAGSGGRPDVVSVSDGETDGDAEPPLSCRACLEAPEDPGPGCAALTAACTSDMKCNIIYECAFEIGCWFLPTQAEIVSCGFPCYARAGVSNPADPVFTLGTPVVQCVLSVCQPACGAKP